MSPAVMRHHGSDEQTQKEDKRQNEKNPASLHHGAGSADLWRFGLLLTGVFLGLLVPWVTYLNYQVTTEFEGRKWDLPSRVYRTGPGSLSRRAATSCRISKWNCGLRATGQRAGSRPGHYRVQEIRVEIYRRPFGFHDGAEQASRFRVRFRREKLPRSVTCQVAVNWTWPGSIRRRSPRFIRLQKEDRTLVKIAEAPPLLRDRAAGCRGPQFQTPSRVLTCGVSHGRRWPI